MKSQLAFRFTVFAVLVIASVVLMGGSCPKQCLDETYCVRECECVDEVRNRVTQCPIAFACNIQERVCETAYDETTCEEICDRYVPRNLCGSKVCTTENDCMRYELCNQFDPNTGQLINQFDCDSQYACDVSVNVCAAGYAAPADQVCQQCFAEQNQ